jgi:type IV fimbrial biogenesis protein FimT
MPKSVNLSMLNARPKLMSGFSLIEVMVIVAIIAILFAFAAPLFGEYTTNTRVRAAAEAFQSDVTLARNEALKRNQPVTLNYSLGVVAPALPLSLIQTTDPCPGPGACPVTTIRSRDLNDESQIVSTPGSAVITFDALGRATTIPPVAGQFTLQMSKPAKSTCTAIGGGGGKVRCMNVVITPTGASRMCDPALSYATNTRGC